MATIRLEFFPTAVTEEKLQEAREKSLRRIFGTTQTLRCIKSPRKWGTLQNILQERVAEHCQEGHKFFSQGEWEKAITCYTKAWNLDPKKVELYEQKAEAFLQLCDFQSASLHLRKAYCMTPAKDECLARLAFILYLQGQSLYEQQVYLDALESFTHASELQPQKTLYRRRSIACLAALKRYNECLQMVNEEVVRDQTNADLFVLRARLYEYFGKPTPCFYNVQEALAIDPGHTEAQLLLEKLRKKAQKNKAQAVSKALKGNLQGALLKINRAIENIPLDADYFLFRGSILRRLKDFSAAIDDYLKAVEIGKAEEGSQASAEAWAQVLLTYNDFAVHCYTKGFYEEAVLLLNKAIKGEKKAKGLYINRGDCFLKLGELNFAIADYQQALEVGPIDAGLQKRISWLYNEMGLQEFRKRRYPEAEAYFSRAIEHNPLELQHYLHRCKTRMFLQEAMGAKEDIATALLLNPTSEEVSLSLRAFLSTLPDTGVSHTLANSLFVGEDIQTIIQSKVADLAKALLEQRLEARPKYEAPPAPESCLRFRLAADQPKEESSRKEEGLLENPAGDRHHLEAKRLYQRQLACWKKANRVNEELNDVREKVSLESQRARLDPNPKLPEKECSDAPYHWKKFSQGIARF
ncbi:PREDICTED: tetratricopeptide repeat protein 16 [Gekko japonicus]|uniref:Tetratricopeptide repeat protein 16 n=1 Tax=Gekko japonicus TaxID=146911 RepID=A0ABM1JWQ1_GEKJA|nr:PREDICTED: tetratricopeptide repeat protein 16 [Gekko japonicus]